MKLPKKVRVLTRFYQVRIDNDMQKFGECDYVRRVIKINLKKCENRDTQLQTLWHEIFHAFAWESGLSNNLHSDGEEFFVENAAAFVISLTGGNIKKSR